MERMMWSLAGVLAVGCGVAVGGEPVNSTCPISGKSFDEAAATVEVGEHTVGFCCPGCIATFEGWSGDKQMEFIHASLKAQPDKGATEDGKKVGDPFPLTHCPIGEDRLGEMGDPVVKEYDGREIRFCCEGCIEPFEEKQAETWAEVDKQIIENQTPYYPLETCVGCGTDLPAGDASPVDFVHRNRLFRVCGDDCKEAVLASPAPAWRKLDAAVKQAQTPHYPLETCIVSGEELGSMGKPRDVVVANRLIRLCCAMCKDGLKKDPGGVLMKVDQAWKDKYGDKWPDISIHSVKEMKPDAGS